MNDLCTHYSQILCPENACQVSAVKHDLASLTVKIHLVRAAAASVVRPRCGEQRQLKDDVPACGWRSLDNMQFETVLVARASDEVLGARRFDH